MTREQIREAFMHHPPVGDQRIRYQEIRNVAAALALLIEEYCPDSREKSLAFTNLQQAVFWANASIAINEKETTVQPDNNG